MKTCGFSAKALKKDRRPGSGLKECEWVFCDKETREIWKGRYHETSGFLVLQMWVCRSGVESGRRGRAVAGFLKIEETITIVDTATAVTHLWLGEE